MGRQVGFCDRLFSLLPKTFLNLAKGLNLCQEQRGLCSVADCDAPLALPAPCALCCPGSSAARGGTALSPGGCVVPCGADTRCLAPASALANTQNESGNVSSRVFSVLLQWAIQERSGERGKGGDPDSSWGRCFQVSLRTWQRGVFEGRCDTLQALSSGRCQHRVMFAKQLALTAERGGPWKVGFWGTHVISGSHLQYQATMERL